MIKHVFLPEKIGTYFLFSKRIVGVDIGKTHINATKILVRGNTIVIEQSYEEKVEAGTPATYIKRATKALKSIFNRMGKYDEIHTALSSSLVIFKELKLPFITHDKISMIINFEVEPLLPFSINDAVVDFIITKKISAEQASEVLVAAVQKQYIAEHLAIFEAANIQPTVITVDMFALYGLFNQMPPYAKLANGIALIDLGLHATRIAFIYNKQLRFIRTLSKGIFHIAKAVSENLDIGAHEVGEDIIRFGLEKPDAPEYEQAITNTLTSFWNEINFTITSFTARMSAKKPIEKIIFLGGGAQMKGLPAFVTKNFNIPCETFQVNTITQNKNIKLKNSHVVPQATIISLSAALPSSITMDFNLRKVEFLLIDRTLLIKQLATIVVLTLALLISLITHYTIQVKKLTREAESSEQEAIRVLQEEFTIPREDKSLSDIIDAAEVEVKNERETWFAFSSQARASFLQYLLELTSLIDKESLAFTIDRITIAEGTIILKAQVKDYEALKILERELRQSKLFSDVEPQDTPSFTMKITLAPTVEELS